MLLMISAPYVILPIRILPSPLFPFLSFLKTGFDHLTTTIHFTQRPSTSLSSPPSFSFSRKLDHHRASPHHFHLRRKNYQVSGFRCSRRQIVTIICTLSLSAPPLAILHTCHSHYLVLLPPR
ncbi:hypothetical protein RND81_10G091500 [Saponaria officinalis]|uniref:Uncharacterized protein n=1 Tax=Saponaria officinalis TaxID=3572 RepID=A0AAW1I066_SAPOF